MEKIIKAIKFRCETEWIRYSAALVYLRVPHKGYSKDILDELIYNRLESFGQFNRLDPIETTFDDQDIKSVPEVFHNQIKGGFFIQRHFSIINMASGEGRVYPLRFMIQQQVEYFEKVDNTIPHYFQVFLSDEDYKRVIGTFEPAGRWYNN